MRALILTLINFGKHTTATGGTDVSNVLSSIAQLLWPAVVAILVIVLLPVIRGLIKSSDSVNIEVGGAKISVQRAAEDIRKLINDLQDRLNAIEARTAPQDRQEVEKAISSPRPAKLLWVDDRPDANVYERARAKDAGYEVLQAESTAAAHRSLASDGPVQLIITDMARVEAGGTYNRTAGLDLIRDLRKAGDLTPVIVYSSSRSLAPVQDDLNQQPNVASTTSPTELISLIGISATNQTPGGPHR
jgi:PleD family two-component response regulator